MSKIALRRHLGQINQSRCLAYPRPNDPPPISRRVIGMSHRGQDGLFPETKSSRMVWSSFALYCADPSRGGLSAEPTSSAEVIPECALRFFRTVVRSGVARTPVVPARCRTRNRRVG